MDRLYYSCITGRRNDILNYINSDIDSVGWTPALCGACINGNEDLFLWILELSKKDLFKKKAIAWGKILYYAAYNGKRDDIISILINENKLTLDDWNEAFVGACYGNNPKLALYIMDKIQPMEESKYVSGFYGTYNTKSTELMVIILVSLFKNYGKNLLYLCNLYLTFEDIWYLYQAGIDINPKYPVEYEECILRKDLFRNITKEIFVINDISKIIVEF